MFDMEANLSKSWVTEKVHFWNVYIRHFSKNASSITCMKEEEKAVWKVCVRMCVFLFDTCIC